MITRATGSGMNYAGEGLFHHVDGSFLLPVLLWTVFPQTLCRATASEPADYGLKPLQTELKETSPPLT